VGTDLQWRVTAMFIVIYAIVMMALPTLSHTSTPDVTTAGRFRAAPAMTEPAELPAIVKPWPRGEDDINPKP